jgi:hypothetical protein
VDEIKSWKVTKNAILQKPPALKIAEIAICAQGRNSSAELSAFS